MKATLYLSILFGPLFCYVVCDTNVDTLHSEIVNIDNVTKFENSGLFHDKKHSSTGVDGYEILVEENGDRVLSLEDDSTLPSSSEIEEHFGESDEVIVIDDFETKEGVSEVFSDEDNNDFSNPTITKVRDFMKIKENDVPRFIKYTRLNAVKEIFPLRIKSSHKDKESSEEVTEEKKDESNKEESVEEVPDEQEWYSNENIPNQEQGRILKSTRNSTVNRFLCRTENEEDSVLVHGARAWTFETQDVNLTLTYPLAQADVLARQYIITGFNVLLVTDGVDSRGYINNGGVLSDNISLSFISPGISSLLYEFEVYGVPRHSILDIDLMNTLFYLCS